MALVATIAASMSGLLLAVPSFRFVEDEPIQIWRPKHPLTLNQVWTIACDEDGLMVPVGCVNIFAGNDPSKLLCISLPTSVTKPGALPHLRPIDKPGGTPSQQWELIEVNGHGNWVYIASALDNNLVLEGRGDSSTPGILIQANQVEEANPNQIWIIDHLESSSVVLSHDLRHHWREEQGEEEPKASPLILEKENKERVALMK